MELPSSRAEEKRDDGAPSGDSGGSESGEIEEVHQAHPRDPHPDEDRLEDSQCEVVQALEADDLRNNQPWIPHHRPIEHVERPAPKMRVAFSDVL